MGVCGLPLGLFEGVVLSLEGLHSLLEGFHTLEDLHVLLHHFFELRFFLLVSLLDREKVVGLEALGTDL